MSGRRPSALDARRRRGHPPAAHPDAVRGRPRQHLPDRGRPADAGRLRAQLGARARRAAAPARRARALARRTSSWWCSPTSTSTTSAWWTSSSATPAPRSRRSTSSCTSSSTSRGRRRATTSSRGGVMLRNGIPEEIVRALQTVSSAFRAWGVEGDGHAAAARRRDPRAARSLAAGAAPARATPLRTRSSGTSERRILIAADHLIKHISSNPLITRPLDAPRGGGPRRAPAGARHLPRVAAQVRARCRRRSCCPATESRSPTTSR